MKTRVLLISQDVMGKRMAGPGIRYFHMARILSQHFPTTVAVTFSDDTHREDDLSYLRAQLSEAQLLPYRPGDWDPIMAAADSAQVLILPSDLAALLPNLADHPAAIVIDGYDPLLAEWLAMETPRQDANLDALWRLRMRQIQPQYLVGDFYICASERQRDWWIGLLEANGRVNPWTFGQDPSLRSLVDVVPYGLPVENPQHQHQVIKGVWTHIHQDDKLVLWGGGLWRWLDPLTAIRAIAQVWKSRPDVRLIFPGTMHPNPILEEMPTFNQEAKALAAELGLLDRVVFFGDWIAYEDWTSVLLEADVGLSLHFDNLETHLANRSRTLEFIWTGLPVITTGLETTSELIRKEQLGIVVPVGDVDQVTQAILTVLDRNERISESAQRRIRDEYSWDHTLSSLIRFCQEPRKAPDRQELGSQLGHPTHVETYQELARWKQHAANLEMIRDDLIQDSQHVGIEKAKLAAQVEAYESTIQEYQALIAQIKNGRFLRAMGFLDRTRQRLRSFAPGQDEKLREDEKLRDDEVTE